MKIFNKIAFMLLICLSFGVNAAWSPIAQTVPQYVDSSGDIASGYVLKFYSASTTTNINLATDNTGGTLATSVLLNSSGYPELSSNIIIPHVEEDFKIVLYPTQAAADADSGAVWTIDDIEVTGEATSEWQDSGITPVYSSSTAFTISGDSTTPFHVGRRIKLTDSGGTDYATILTSAYSSPNTTVTVSLDSSGSLDSGISTVQLSILSANNIALPYIRKNNLSATTNPATTDDVDGSYYVGSVWINTSTNSVYTNTDNTDNAAVWTLTSGSEVGDITQSIRLTKTGWFLLRGQTMGSASSGATEASAAYIDLYTVLWTNCADTECAVSSGRGASAAADFAANKTLTIPDARGRTLIAQDDMGGASANTVTHAQADLLGGNEGAETHLLTSSESGLPAHAHRSNASSSGSNLLSGGAISAPVSGSSTSANSAANASSPHNNMQPYLTVNTFIKY